MECNGIESELRNWISIWNERLNYYMEENVPDEHAELVACYKQAREFLSDRLTEIWGMTRRYICSQDVNRK